MNEYEKPDDLLGDQGILQQLTKALVERALEGELMHQLGYRKHEAAGAGVALPLFNFIGTFKVL